MILIKIEHALALTNAHDKCKRPEMSWTAAQHEAHVSLWLHGTELLSQLAMCTGPVLKFTWDNIPCGQSPFAASSTVQCEFTSPWSGVRIWIKRAWVRVMQDCSGSLVGGFSSERSNEWRTHMHSNECKDRWNCVGTIKIDCINGRVECVT